VNTQIFSQTTERIWTAGILIQLAFHWCWIRISRLSGKCESWL